MGNNNVGKNEGAVLWVHMNPELHAAFKQLAKMRGVSMARLTRVILRKVCENAGTLEMENKG